MNALRLRVSQALSNSNFGRASALSLSIVVLYWPTYEKLIQTVWTQEQYAQGALIPFISCALFWRLRRVLQATQSDPRMASGLLLLLCALVMLTLGRRSSIILLETASQLPLIAAIVLVSRGSKALKICRFPMIFLAFMIPLPGMWMYTLTAYLKSFNADLVVSLLYHLGYPVGIEGVVISIGPYQLFLADACAGLNSLFALTALGLIPIYLARHSARLPKLILAAFILPIALLSNFVRVITLLLITYHFHDGIAEQLHELVGYLVFFAAIYILLWLDGRLLSQGRRNEG